jgi:hypothetical protein
VRSSSNSIILAKFKLEYSTQLKLGSSQTSQIQKVGGSSRQGVVIMVVVFQVDLRLIQVKDPDGVDGSKVD